MRCMTAIWPAGPPKLRSATFDQTRNASAREGNVWPAVEVAASLEAGLTEDMVRPSVGVGRDSSACRLVGRSLPHGKEKIAVGAACQAVRPLTLPEFVVRFGGNWHGLSN